MGMVSDHIFNRIRTTGLVTIIQTAVLGAIAPWKRQVITLEFNHVFHMAILK